MMYNFWDDMFGSYDEYGGYWDGDYNQNDFQLDEVSLYNISCMSCFRDVEPGNGNWELITTQEYCENGSCFYVKHIYCTVCAKRHKENETKRLNANIAKNDEFAIMMNKLMEKDG